MTRRIWLHIYALIQVESTYKITERPYLKVVLSYRCHFCISSIFINGSAKKSGWLNLIKWSFVVYFKCLIWSALPFKVCAWCPAYFPCLCLSLHPWCILVRFSYVCYIHRCSSRPETLSFYIVVVVFTTMCFLVEVLI